MSIRQETVIPLTNAPDHFPVKPSLHAIYRWTSKGGGGVKLESFKQGGKRFTSVEAIERFAVAQNQSPSERADEELAKEGC